MVDTPLVLNREIRAVRAGDLPNCNQCELTECVELEDGKRIKRVEHRDGKWTIAEYKTEMTDIDHCPFRRK